MTTRATPKYNYASARGMKIVDEIFAEFEAAPLERGDIARIAREHKMPPRTVGDWYGKWADSPDYSWRPGNHSSYAKCNRIFTDEQEAMLCERIQTEFIDKHLLFTNHDFKMLAIAAYYDWYPIDVESEHLTAKDFHASNGFVCNFKQRHSVSSRRAHYKRRPPGLRAMRDETIRRWTEQIQALLRERRNERSYVVNCDETCWRLYPSGILTWAKKGTDGVSLEIPGNEKASITALATITADNTQLPLFLIAKGKTKRVELTQLGDISEHRGDHSASGWTTAETMTRYLLWLREQYPPVHTPSGDKILPIDLILDCYPAHLTAIVRSTAASMDIRLHFVPVGLTDVLQPLDRRVFGCLKATARREYRRFCWEHPGERVRTAAAVTMLKNAWGHLSIAAMEAAWLLYDGEIQGHPENEVDDWDPDPCVPGNHLDSDPGGTSDD